MSASKPRGPKSPAAASNQTHQILGRDPNAGFERRGKISGPFKEHYRRLSEMRDELLDRLRNLLGDAQESQPDYITQMGDAGTETFDRDYNLSMISSYQQQLFEIEDALRRIEEGRYGVCELTGEPIPPERLDAIPWTRFSLAAEQQLESNGTPPLRFEMAPPFAREALEPDTGEEPDESE